MLPQLRVGRSSKKREREREDDGHKRRKNKMEKVHNLFLFFSLLFFFLSFFPPQSLDACESSFGVLFFFPARHWFGGGHRRAIILSMTLTKITSQPSK